jgi:hypothetical protein
MGAHLLPLAFHTMNMEFFFSVPLETNLAETDALEEATVGRATQMAEVAAKAAI